ncbi:MAG TPA: hypothetical protein VH595_17070 [Verrucomicrobiae bacterium]|jgi:hypothetical protein|nr:hypothetical protein [Verrucomicrobiae bacterium]
MNKPTAVIDKSLLQAICEQPGDKRDMCFNALLNRYLLVVPEILVEEVWANLANPTGGKSLATINMMIRCLLHLRDAWIAEPLEIAFLELVKHDSMEVLPKPSPSVMNSFFILKPDGARLKKWFKDRKELQKSIIRQRVSEHAHILKTEAFAPVKSGRDFFEKFIRPKFAQMLSDPDRKRKLLEGVLGFTFRARHPDCSQEIDAAFEAYSPDTFDRYSATLNCIMGAMFYFYAPLCKMVGPSGETRKLLGRSFDAQRSNLNDEKYVQSALLCSRLATRDEGMRNVMELFKACGLWNGQMVFVDPKKDVTTEIPRCFS